MTDITESPFETSTELHRAAIKEGWDIFKCEGSANGTWQIQRLDTPNDFEDFVGEVPPMISDREAWGKVMGGSEEHHVVAREFIQTANPLEYEAMTGLFKNTN